MLVALSNLNGLAKPIVTLLVPSNMILLSLLIVALIFADW
jgi:hypothetical protein